MTPCEIILSLVGALSDREMKLLQERLGSAPCERIGHKYKAVGQVTYWFTPPQVKLVCTQCGAERLV